jgi:phage-related protein
MSGSKVFSRIGETFTSIWEGFKANFEVMKENTVNWGKNIIQGLIDGIASMASAVANTVTNIAGSIADAFTGFFGINSPSKLFAEYGGYIDEGLSQGIAKNSGTVTDAMGDLNSAVMGAVGTNYSSRQIATQSDSGIYGLLSEYLPYLAQGSNVNVALEGNTDGIFNLIRKADSEFRKQTGASAFA